MSDLDNIRHDLALIDKQAAKIAELEAKLVRYQTDYDELALECQQLASDKGNLEGVIRFMVEMAADKHRPAYDEQQAKIAELEKENKRLRVLVDRTCGAGCHCMEENNGKCAALEGDK